MIDTVKPDVLHVSHAEAISDIKSILERVEAGAEIVVEKDRRPVAVIRQPSRPGRKLSECIALAEAHGSTVTLDAGFGADLTDIIASHEEPLDGSRWD
jgi:antitoxin (DNA-binding transcriptional repressor) of toxin-antitoxin stability system